jgi:hypothetical protein
MFGFVYLLKWSTCRAGRLFFLAVDELAPLQQLILEYFSPAQPMPII